MPLGLRIESSDKRCHCHFSSYARLTYPLLSSPPWIKSIEDFATFLRNSSMAEAERQEGTVIMPPKIAIIDDGINATLADVQERIANGATFSSRSQDFESMMNSYFVPLGNTGTLMAQLICSLCPDVKLYIARLEELPMIGKTRHVTAESAAKVSRVRYV